MTAEPVIRLENVTRTYHAGDVDVQALSGVTLVVEQGEFVAIMGSSGSGKSTLMSIIGCLDRPTSGRYLLQGVDVAALSEPELARIRSERLGFVFQSFNLLPRTPAIENVALPLVYCEDGALGGAARAARAREALALLGLGDRERNTPGQLSGGQQQRVAIARALINHPGLVLADEPTGNLDTHTSHEIMQTLVGLNREQGVTIVVVTHEADIAAYADRVITMRDGKVVEDRRNPAKDDPAKGGATPQAAPRAGATSTAPIDGPIRGLTPAFAVMILQAALQALARNRMRSVLTMLGVFVGVAALIAMVGLGKGADEAVRKQIESLGTNMAVVLPGATTSGGVRSGAGSASSLRVADAQAILREAPAVGAVAYLIRSSGQVKSMDQNWTTQIQGVSPGYAAITNWRIASGRGITAEDDDKAALVVVLGKSVAEQLFGESADPIDATINVKGAPLRVIGVLASKGQSPIGQDQDDLVMIPFSTAERKVLGVAAPGAAATSQLSAIYNQAGNPYGLQARLTGRVNQIFIQATGPDRVQTAIDEATATLRRQHRTRPGDDADFSIRNLSQIAETARSSSQIMAVLLAVVASISLLVGGIGIMNILLVSVTERTREIGLRMAIGARRLHVLLQFLAESICLSGAGGLAGVAAGLAASSLIAFATGWPIHVPTTAAVGGFLFSAVVGVFFGFYPARKAARLDPIEALRFE